MFGKEGKGGRRGKEAKHSKHQPAHSAGSRYTPEEQEELLQPLNTGMMEALVDYNEQVSHPAPADPFEPMMPFEEGENPAFEENADEGKARAFDDEPVEDGPATAGPDVQASSNDWAPSEEEPAAVLSESDGQSLPDAAAAHAASADVAPADPARDEAAPSEPEAKAEPSATETERVNPLELSRYQRDGAQYTHRKSRSSRKKRIIIGAVVCVAAVFLVFGGLAFAWWNGMANSIALGDRSIEEELKDPVVSEPYWTLILGSDSRENTQNGSRSDVIILARIDQAAKKVTLVSIPRDTKVTINGETMKINAAYGVGGATQAIQTIEEYAGIEISHYVEIYFDGFSDLVDKLGGVTVDVPERASYAGVTIEPGLQTLNGKQALTLARNRKTYTDGDFTRTECQRLLVQALVSKVLQQDITQIPDTINAIAGCFSTDIPLQDLIALATSMQGMGSDSIYMAMAPSTTGMIGSASYTFTYIDQWKLIMQKAKSGEDPTLTEKEAEICGDASTQDYDLDMSEPIDEETMAALEEYWAEQAAKALEEQQKQTQAAQSGGGEGNASDSGGTAGQN